MPAEYTAHEPWLRWPPHVAEEFRDLFRERVAEQTVARAAEQGRSQALLEPDPVSVTPSVGSRAAPVHCDRREPRQKPRGPHQCNRATRARALATTALMIKPYSVIPWPRWLRSRSPSLALSMIDETS